MNMQDLLYSVAKKIGLREMTPIGIESLCPFETAEMQASFFHSKQDWLRPHRHNSLCKQMRRLFFPLSLRCSHTNTVSDIHLAVSCSFFPLMSWLHNKKTHYPVLLPHHCASPLLAIWSTLASTTAWAAPAVRADRTESRDKLTP